MPELIKSGDASEGQDARMLGEFLKMVGKDPDICRIYKIKKDADSAFLKSLLDSNHRFLHVSAHGDRKGFFIQDKNGTNISARDIEEYCKKRKSRAGPYKPLHKKFLTISACGHVSADFVKKLHSSTGVTAVISALSSVGFAESALFSSLFYFSLLDALRSNMPKKLSERVALYVDVYQRTKIAYLGVGGYGAHRLDYWWDAEHVIVN